MAEYDIKATLDCKGMLCPMPVVKTSKKFKELEIGDVLEMISTDPGAIPDMQAWSNQTGHDLLESIEEDGIFRFIMKKTH